MEDFDFFGNNANANEAVPPPPPPNVDGMVDNHVNGNDGMNGNGNENEDNDIVRLHYFGGVDVPENVTHVTVDPSVEEIEFEAFIRRRRLTTVELPEGLERIGRYAFEDCKRLCRINIPSSVKGSQ